MTRDCIEIEEAREGAPCLCEDCGWKGVAEDLHPTCDAILTPGDPVPAGRCPECSTLAYLEEEDNHTSSTLMDVRDKLREWQMLSANIALSLRHDAETAGAPQNDTIGKIMTFDHEGLAADLRIARAALQAAAEVLEALIMVRDAENDRESDGLPTTIPAEARGVIDAAIRGVAAN